MSKRHDELLKPQITEMQLKPQIEMQLYTLIRERLFGEGPWIADREKFYRLFIELGLRERVPGKPDETRPAR